MSYLSYFLDTIWKDTDGYVYLALKSEDMSFHRVSPKWPEQKDQVLDFIMAQTAQQKEVYYSPAIWKQKIGNGVQLSKDLFLGSHVLWVDMDGNAPDGWPPADLDGDLTSTDRPGAATDVPEPSLRVQTSDPSNQHMYWLLDEMVTDVNTLENMTRSLYLKLNADSGFDATRILRPPDTTNYGYGKEERKGKTYPVFLDTTSDRVYSVSSFPVVKDFRPLVDKKLGEIPPIEEVLAKCKWSDHFWKAFNAEGKQGKRSDQLQELAYLGAEAGFTDEQIYAVILNADDRWKKYSTRTDRHLRLVDIIERARDKHPMALSDLSFAGIIGDDAVDVTEMKTLYNFKEFMETKISLDWVVNDLLPVNDYGIIAGPTGIGKTQLGIRFAEKIVTGDHFLLWRNAKTKNYRVLLYSLEMSHGQLQRFFNVMGSEFLETGHDRFFIVPIGDTVPLDHPDGQKFFEKKLDEVRPDVVIIDSLSKSMKGDFKDDEAVRIYNAYLNKMRAKYDTAIITIHHNRKMADRKNIGIELDDLYGSRFLAQDAAFVLMMGKSKEGELILNPAKLRFSADPGPLLLKRSDRLDFYIDRSDQVVHGDDTDTGPRDGISSLNLFG